MHTTAFWLHFPEAFLARFADLTPTEKQSGLVALGALLRTAGSLRVMCDPRDLGLSITEAIGGQPPDFRAEFVSVRQLPGRHWAKRASIQDDQDTA